MSNYKISLQRPHSSIPSHFYDGGVVYLDLGTDFDLEFFNAPTKTKIDGFSEVAVLETDFPSTPKNDLIFALYNDVNFLNPDYSTPILVLCENGGDTLPQTALQIGRYSKSNGIGKYSAQLTYSNDDIVTKLKTTKLADLMGNVEATFTMDSILNTYQPMEMYDGSSAICYPNQNYGRFYYIDQSTPVLPFHAVEFRPNLFAAAVFERAFCGFRLSGSFVNTEFFKRLHSYDLRRDYDKIMNYKRGFDRYVNTVDINALTPNSFKVYHSSVNSDPDNNYQVIPNTNAGASSTNRHGVYEVNANFAVFTFSPTTYSFATVVFSIRKLSGEIIYSESKDFFTPPDNVYEFTFNGVVDLDPSDGVFIQVDGLDGVGLASVANGYTVHYYNSAFSIKPVKDCTPYEGEVFYLREALDQDTTVYDYIKGVSDAVGLCYTINRATGVIGIYPENGNAIFSEAYTKLINSNLPPLDWSDKCDPDNLNIIFPKENKAIKDITVKWRDATDIYITEVLNPNPELYSYYELVNGNGTESFKLENNLFEPTATDRYYFTSDYANAMSVLPILIDNQDNQKSYNLGHRLFLLVGQVWAGGVTNRYLSEFSGATDTSLLSFGTMYFTGGLFKYPLGVPTLFTFDKNLTYDKETDNLYTTFIKPSALERINTAQFDKPILLSREDFNNYDFTRLVVVRTQLNQVLCKVNMIKGFSFRKQQYTPVTLIPYVPQC